MANHLSRVCEVLKGMDDNGGGEDVAKLEDIFRTAENCRPCLNLLDRITVDPDTIYLQRKKGVPLEYILGLAPFMERLFACNRDTLIPRKCTSVLVNTALSFIRREQNNGRSKLTVVEIGTGCGNIAVTLALNSRNTVIHASDICGNAARVAKQNVDNYELGDRVHIHCGDLFESFENGDFRGKVDMVVCNPPYIPNSSLKKLAREIIDHEPVLALKAGAYGIDIFRRLIKESVEYLRPNGVLAFEFGTGQDKLVNRILLNKKGYRDIRVYPYNGDYRVASAHWQPD